MIHCRNLTKRYTMGGSTVYALHDVSLTIEAGEFVAIMGPSGSGKSTLMNVLGLLDTVDSGEYTLLGKPTQHLDELALAELRGRTLGFVFQQFHLLKRTSALENVALPLLYTTGEGADPAALLDQVGLANRAHHHPNELSGGQQQRVAIARALVNQPALILADEPTGNLDSQSQDDIMQLFKSLNQSGITILLVTHEEEVAAHASRIIRMRDGRILSDSKPAPDPETSLGALPLSQSPTLGQWIKKSYAHFTQAFRSITANKLRSFLSMLGILIGVGAVIAMMALGTGAQKSIEARLSSLGSNLLVLRPGSSQSRGVSLESGSISRLTQDDSLAIRGLPHVRRTNASVNGRVQIDFGDKNSNTQLLGAESSYAVMRASVPVLGRFYTEQEDRSRAKVAVIGATVAQALFGDPKSDDVPNPVGKWIRINRIRFQVIGLLPPKGGTSWRDEDDVVVIPLTTAMKRVLGKDFINSIDIEVDSSDAMTEVQDATLALMDQRHPTPGTAKDDAYSIRNMADIQDALNATSQTFSMLLSTIATISLLVGGIGIMNIMLVSVTERTREIGLRKAIGATPTDILMQFLIEAIVVSLAGGGFGVLLGCGTSLLIGQTLGWTMIISVQSIGLAFAFSAAIGIVFGLWPAKRAAKLNPIDALRHE
ncbi:MAG: ABC transporter permease [Candidatus Margulisiibacteriota bacterium]